MSNVCSSEVGVAYKTDHSPLFLEFSMDSNLHGRGYWKIPTYLVNDQEFQNRVVDLIKDIEKTNVGTHPSVMWDTIQASIRGLAIKYSSEIKCKKKKISYIWNIFLSLLKICVLH